MPRVSVLCAAALLLTAPALAGTVQSSWDALRDEVLDDGVIEGAPAEAPAPEVMPTDPTEAARYTMTRFLRERERMLAIPMNGPLSNEAALAQVEELEKTLQAIRVDLKSLSASDNLRAIMEAQDRYREAHGEYLAFERGDEQTWAALGVTLPGPVLHEFRTTIYDGMFTVVAEGNLDDDPFTDLWYGHMRDGEYMPGQLTSDALDVDMYPDAH